MEYQRSTENPNLQKIESELPLLSKMKISCDTAKPYLSVKGEQVFLYLIFRLVEYSKNTSSLRFCFHCFSIRHKDRKIAECKYSSVPLTSICSYKLTSESSIKSEWLNFVTKHLKYFETQDYARQNGQGAVEYRLPSFGRCSVNHGDGTQDSFKVYYNINEHEASCYTSSAYVKQFTHADVCVAGRHDGDSGGVICGIMAKCVNMSKSQIECYNMEGISSRATTQKGSTETTASTSAFKKMMNTKIKAMNAVKTSNEHDSDSDTDLNIRRPFDKITLTPAENGNGLDDRNSYDETSSLEMVDGKRIS